MDFDIDIEDDLTEYERLRAKNMKEFEAMISEFKDDVDTSVNALNDYKKPRSLIPHQNRKAVKNGDSTFVFTGTVPFERRRSSRLSNIAPQYSYEDLIDEEELKYEREKYSDDVNDLEKVVFKKKKSYPRKFSSSVYVPAENITENYLENVASRVTVKVYCAKNGTSCHQCRQKTLDSKTYCRSGRCVGVRGQFCGVCLKNRYGEDAKEALLNPKWECPPCRDLCNCSICRTRAGKRPTGILAPLAFQYGHKSVKDFLMSLNGIGDYADESTRKKDLNNYCKVISDDNISLIGFNEDLKPLWTSTGNTLNFREDEGDLIGFDKDGQPVMTKM